MQSKHYEVEGKLNLNQLEKDMFDTGTLVSVVTSSRLMNPLLILREDFAEKYANDKRISHFAGSDCSGLHSWALTKGASEISSVFDGSYPVKLKGWFVTTSLDKTMSDLKTIMGYVRKDNMDSMIYFISDNGQCISTVTTMKHKGPVNIDQLADTMNRDRHPFSLVFEGDDSFVHLLISKEFKRNYRGARLSVDGNPFSTIGNSLDSYLELDDQHTDYATSELFCWIIDKDKVPAILNDLKSIIASHNQQLVHITTVVSVSPALPAAQRTMKGTSCI